MDRRHSSVKAQMSATGMAVRSSRVSSWVRRVEITCSASSMGTFVNKLVTSKLIRVSSWCRSMFLTMSAKCEEFFTNASVLPARGARMMTPDLTRVLSLFLR